MTSAPPTMPSEPTVVEGTGPVAPGRGVPLPSTGTGERRSRREQRKRQQRRRTIVALGTTMILAGVAMVLTAVGGGALWHRLDHPDDLRRSAREAAGGEAAATVPVTTRLVVHEDAAGAVTGLTVFVPEADRTGGAVIFVPVGAMVEVPSFGLEPVGRAQQLGGLPLLQQTVENLLGFRFDEVVPVGPDDAAALVEPLGSLTVDIPERVEEIDGRGRVRVLFDRGPTEVRPEGVEDLLEARGQSTDLGRLVRHQAFWSAWFRAVSDAIARDGRVSLPPEAGGLVEVAVAYTAGDVRYEVLPVEALSTGGPDDGGLYQVDRAELQALLRRVASHVTSAAGDERIEVQLLNGTGVPGVAQLITPRLVTAGAEVKLVGNADRFDYDETQIVYYDPAQRAAAEAVREALGAGQVVFSRQGLDVVDVTVVVGTDLAGGEASGTDARE